MGYLHAKGIVHKDLKSKNVFHDTNKVVITDFGLFGISGVVQEGRWGTAPSNHKLSWSSVYTARLLPRELQWSGKLAEACSGNPAPIFFACQIVISIGNGMLVKIFFSFSGVRINSDFRTVGFVTWRRRLCVKCVQATMRIAFPFQQQRTCMPLGKLCWSSGVLQPGSGSSD